jgi:lipoprotein-anchoring transpeptidase ErfK/SrfK
LTFEGATDNDDANDPRFRAASAALRLASACLPEPRGVVARISLLGYRMDVYMHGAPRYSWPVSTARRGRTPTGTFRPTALAVWHSGSPILPQGYAIHGSYEVKYLGRPASHGCIRLHPSAAKQLFSLVRQYGAANTVIQIVY